MLKGLSGGWKINSQETVLTFGGIIYLLLSKNKIGNKFLKIISEIRYNSSMENIEIIKHEIVEHLKPIGLEKIILFGSYAYGTPTKDSDIDLYVVTRDDFIPKNFKESMQIKLKVSRAIKDLQKIIPIDTIIHTKAMSRKFVIMGSSFSKEIFSKGILLYG